MIANTLKKTYKLLVMCALAVCIIFLCGAFSYTLPKGVTVNGVDVGGLTRARAVRLLREDVENCLKDKQLRICADERVYTYSYPEIGYDDQFPEVLSSVKKRGEYTADVYYYLNGIDEICGYICGGADRLKVEPYALFNRSGEPFSYFGGNDGREIDGEGLKRDIIRSLNNGFYDVKLSVKSVTRRNTMDDVKARTSLLYSFTTYFDGTNVDRSANIRLAADKINGTVILPDETFSFNAAVGERTVKNGFRTAKIIQNGKFIDGVGGGVCQVSTTLYNAALLSGLQMEEYHPHSLAVSYVSPSRDAMVSGKYFDLKFKNNRLTPVYIRVGYTFNSITCRVFGESDGWKYSFLSEVTGSIERPPDTVVEGDEDRVITYGREGTLSCGYLVAERDGRVVTKLIRKDKYGACGAVYQIKKEIDGEVSEEGNKG